MRHLIRFLVVCACVVPIGLFVGCATEEIPQYGDPSKLVGGAGPGAGASSSGGGSTSSSGGMCVVNTDCAVKWSTDVFPILETTAKCSDGACHAPSASQAPAMTAGDAAATYAVLTTHKFLEEPADDYIVPCDPAASKMMCNLKLDPVWGTNMYGSCAPRMPKVSVNDAVDDKPLSLDELNKIAEWITCGAPNN